MSRQSEAKERMGYNPKPVLQICANCANYRSDWKDETREMIYAINRVVIEQGYREINRRCHTGEFVVLKTATCNEWRLKA